MTHRDPAGYYIYSLKRPLQPGGGLQLDFDLAYISRGFENNVTNTAVVENGTFVNSSVLPGLGYEPRAELSEDSTRRKYGLAPKERMASLDDQAARANNYISVDADWVDFEATVSTIADQIALAPGVSAARMDRGKPALLSLQDGRADPQFLFVLVRAV